MSFNKNRSGSFASLQNMFKEITMSQRLSAKDPEYAKYAGGDYETAQKIALIDLIKEKQLLPDYYTPLLDLYRAHLDKQRKAFFATIGSKELTQLGFLIGMDKGGKINATNPDFSQYAETNNTDIE